MNWKSYLHGIVGNDRQVDIAKKVGVDQTAVSRWLKVGTVPRDPQTVASVARAYGRPVPEAFVAAGYITEEEAKVRPAARPSLDDLSDADLLAEIRTRMEARHATQAEDQAGSSENVQGAGPGAPIDLAQARKVKDDPAAFGDQPRRGDLDQGKLQPPPAPEKSAAWRTRNRGKEIRDDHDDRSDD